MLYYTLSLRFWLIARDMNSFAALTRDVFRSELLNSSAPNLSGPNHNHESNQLSIMVVTW